MGRKGTTKNKPAKSQKYKIKRRGRKRKTLTCPFACFAFMFLFICFSQPGKKQATPCKIKAKKTHRESNINANKVQMGKWTSDEFHMFSLFDVPCCSPLILLFFSQFVNIAFWFSMCASFFVLLFRWISMNWGENKTMPENGLYPQWWFFLGNLMTNQWS